MKRKSTSSSGSRKLNQTAKLLRNIATLSARVKENEFHLQNLLAALVHAATTDSGPKNETAPSSGGSGSNVIGNDEQSDFWKDIVNNEIQSLLQKSDNFSAPCMAILEGMSAAANAGDNLGAARAFASFQKCMARPRPKIPTPGQ